VWVSGVSEELRRSLNRLRHNSINEELFDVVAEFNALKEQPTTRSP
jgi:F0F1-type ATP synthase gamma subunit